MPELRWTTAEKKGGDGSGGGCELALREKKLRKGCVYIGRAKKRVNEPTPTKPDQSNPPNTILLTMVHVAFLPSTFFNFFIFLFPF